MLSTVEDSIEPNINLDDKNKRILWLINHTTLREFEVPLLISLGFEVYTPKQIPDLIYEWSGSVTHQYDEILTIPKEDLERLNQHDFYDMPITKPIAEILNRHFGSVFCVFYPKLIQSLVRNFDGHILLRAFGLDQSTTYSKQICFSLGRDFLDRLRELGNRFWFSQSYANLGEIEAVVLQSRSVFHPLGLSEKFFFKRNTWVGGENKILFFCSRILASPTYYGKIYESFKKHFGNLPHRIAGNQPIPVKDPHVMGLQPRVTIDQWLQSHNVMFYHSQEPRHLHYHPLEAIVVGMPLIYMRGGILEQLGGEDQPGACSTFKEAKEKIKRILAGDKTFIKQLRGKQNIILEHFTHEYATEKWQENFISQIIKKEIIPHKSPTKTRTIAVLLPLEYKGGTLNAAKNIAKMIHLGSRKANEPIRVVFSCVANHYDVTNEFSDLKELGILIREATWHLFETGEISQALAFNGQFKFLNHPVYTFPTESINNFNDCDFLLIVSDRVSFPIAPIKPYGMVVYDYIQRYVPEIMLKDTQPTYDTFITNARDAEFIITTTPTTAQDAIQYAGVSPHRVHVAPMEFEPLPVYTDTVTPTNLPPAYFIWPTNPTPHKNHQRALEALSIYYLELNGQFDVIMTGSHSDLFCPEKNIPCDLPTILAIRNLISKMPILKDRLHIKGELVKSAYINVASGAKFLWHPTLIDNGTYAVIEAAYLGVPSLSSNYPQMQFINERFHLNLCFFNPTDPRDMALKLKLMEEQYALRCENLPEQTFLDQFNYENQAPAFWRMIRSLI